MNHSGHRFFAVLIMTVLSAFAARAVDLSPKLDQPDEEIEQMMLNCRVAEGLKLNLFAAEPMLAHPVSICVDERGRVFVAELDRLIDPSKPVGHKDTGVLDNRIYTDFLDEDMACRTVEDRIAMLKKHMPEKGAELTVVSDRIRLIEDRDGDGKADHSTVFAEGFREMADGPAAGVLAHKGNVWFTCIPNLWLLRDTKNTGKADYRKILQTGYGVRIAFLGHDLHGLILGPDGRLYFSIGDRGYNVTSEGRNMADNKSGAVFRCEQNGSNLEVVATGMRNPQELAFDQYGNLFAGDNNCDKGDPCRLVWVVDGGDSGWRIGYQHIIEPNITGPWHAEKLWSTAFEGQAGYVLPPVGHVTIAGPSGFAFYPGTGLPAAYKDHFLICDYRGAKGQVLSFAVKPRGASFEVVDQSEFLGNLQATDVKFGTDGSVYTSVWFGPVSQTDKGRIYRVSDPSLAHDAGVLEVKKLLAEGFEQRKPDELARLLAHGDQRIRQEAQFELAERGATAEFAGVLEKSTQQLARLHAIWGLGQIARGKQSDIPLAGVLNALNDADMEVRAQAAKVIGECRNKHGFDGLMAILKTGSPRAKFFAAMSLGKLGEPLAIPALIEMLRENDDKDAYLRHAGVMALTELGEKNFSLAMTFSRDKSPAVRMAVLLMLRRMNSADIAIFLQDAEPKLVVEAARAINDVPIAGAMPALAALIKKNLMWRFSPGELFSAERWSPPAKLEPGQSAPAPASVTQGTLKSATFSAENYDPRGLKISGILPVLMGGTYSFWVTGSDTCELWLSTDDKPENKRLIALSKSKTDPAAWTKGPEQQSYPVNLVAGNRYYVEAILIKSPHKEHAAAPEKPDWGVKKAANDIYSPSEKDHISIGWQFPNGRMQRPITDLGSDDQMALVRRVLNANFRLGGKEQAEELAGFATRPEVPAVLRAEAIMHLAHWASPPPKDAIVNLWRPIEGRDQYNAIVAITPVIRGLLNNDAEEVQSAAIRAAGKLAIIEVTGRLYELATHDRTALQPRLYALDALSDIKDENLLPAIRIALESSNSKLRQEGLNLLADFSPQVAMPLLTLTLDRPDIPEKQNALAILAKMKNTAADSLIVQQMQKLLKQQVEPEVQLDILEAAQASTDHEAVMLVDKYQSNLPKFSELAPFNIALKGGNGDLGRKLFYENASAQCIRCHKINGNGGDVGPDLKGIGSRKDRAYLLESIISPSAQIAVGYETVVVKLKDGRVVTGTIKKDDDTELSVSAADGKVTKIRKEDIQARKSQKISTMPPMGELLTKRDVRNLVEFLSNLK